MYKIAVIPGDGIGTEVINSGVEVLKVLSKSFKICQLNFVSLIGEQNTTKNMVS